MIHIIFIRNTIGNKTQKKIVEYDKWIGQTYNDTSLFLWVLINKEYVFFFRHPTADI